LLRGRVLQQVRGRGPAMKTNGFRHVYGPVSSRRLGRSLGIDIVPFKTCTYDCIYCQLGRTTVKTLDREEYVPIEEVLAELERKLAASRRPDYISVAGSGEPTLHARIGELIEGIKGLTSIPVAVLTNGSLLWMPAVQGALMKADLVLPSLDAGDESLFQYVNRPHRGIPFDRMVEGIAEFTRRFPGEVWLEVLLLGGVTGVSSEVKKIAALVRRIGPARVQLNTAHRPPAEKFAFPMSLNRLHALKDLFQGRVDIICDRGREVGLPAADSGIEDAEILALLGRRPCTAADVAQGLGIHVTEALKHLEALTAMGEVRAVTASGNHFYAVPPWPKGEVERTAAHSW